MLSRSRLFGLKTKSRGPSERLEEAEPLHRHNGAPPFPGSTTPFAGSSKQDSLARSPKHSGAPPTTPEMDYIVSFPSVTPQAIPDLMADTGESTPLSVPKKAGRTTRHKGGSDTPHGFAFGSPQSPSPRRGALTRGSAKSPRASAKPVCVFCSITETDYALEDGPVHQLKCGHYSHNVCLARLHDAVKDAGGSEVLCALCDAPANASDPDIYTSSDALFTSAANFSPGFRPGISQQVSRGVVGRRMAWSSSLLSSASLSPGSPDSTLHQDQGSPSRAQPSHQGETLNSPGLPIERLGAPLFTQEPEQQSLREAPSSPQLRETRSVSDRSSVSTGRMTLPSTTEQAQHWPLEVDESASCHSATARSDNQQSEAGSISPSSLKSADSILTSSAYMEMDSMFQSDLATRVQCSPRMHAFKILTASETNESNKTRILLALRVEKSASNLDLLSDFRPSGKDIQCSTKMRQRLAGAKIHSKSIPFTGLTGLRLHCVAEVTSPDSRTLRWKDAEIFLFSDIILIKRGPTISAAISLREKGFHVNVEASRPTIVEVRSDSTKITDLNFRTSSIAEAYMWKYAFENPAACFPLARGDAYDSYVTNLERYLEDPYAANSAPFVPARIILCLPVNTGSQQIQMQQTLRSVLQALSYRDGLGLILYTSQGVHRVINFEAPHSASWQTALSGLPEAITETKAYDLDVVLREAGRLLDQRSALDATSSIILVCDRQGAFRGVPPPTLTHLHIPVHVIGVSEQHNALTLSVVARQMLGSYNYVGSSNELDQLLRGLVKAETRYTHKNVVLRLKTRINTRISQTWGGDSVPSLELASLGTAQHYVEPPRITTSKETTVFEWFLGSLRMGDIRSLVLEVTGEVPTGSNILQVGVEATNVLSPSDTACTSMFRISVSSNGIDERMKSLLYTLCATQSALTGLEYALKALNMNESRVAYEELLRGLQRIESMQRSGDVTAVTDLALLEAYRLMFDRSCDSMVQGSHRTPGFMLELLQQVWLMHSYRSFLNRNPLEAVLFDVGQSK